MNDYQRVINYQNLRNEGIENDELQKLYTTISKKITCYSSPPDQIVFYDSQHSVIGLYSKVTGQIAIFDFLILQMYHLFTSLPYEVVRVAITKNIQDLTDNKNLLDQLTHLN